MLNKKFFMGGAGGSSWEGETERGSREEGREKGGVEACECLRSIESKQY